MARVPKKRQTEVKKALQAYGLKLEAIREDRAPLVDGAEGRRSVALIEAIYRSVDRGYVNV